MESPVCGTSVSPLGAEGACSCPVVRETVCSEQQQEQCTTETTEVCAVLYCAVLYCTVLYRSALTWPSRSAAPSPRRSASPWSGRCASRSDL